MTTRKNYNSIVFLTTLSVYLGLVLVGAPPAALAQAALTQKLEIKNEAELKDDLDKKPDDEKALDVYVSTLENLFSLAKDFSSKNSAKLRGDKYEFDCFADIFSDKSAQFRCGGGSGLFSSDFTPSLQKINQVFAHTSGKEQVKVSLILTADEFALKTALNYDLKDFAGQYHNFYDAALSRIKLQRLNNPRIIIYQNTSISFENNQVFIITRLPRASIDEILAKNAR
jgi:hypothetical protein